MILANIGNGSFVLENLEQANQLMEILSTAKQVRRRYIPNKHEYIVQETEYIQDVDVQIVKENQIFSAEDGRTMLNEDTANNCIELPIRKGSPGPE